MKTDEEYLKDAVREIEIMLNGLPLTDEPVSTKKGTTRPSSFIGEHEAMARMMGPFLKSRGHDPKFITERTAWDRKVTYRHPQSGFAATFDEHAFLMRGKTDDHPVVQFTRALVAYLERDAIEAREVYQDPHIVIF